MPFVINVTKLNTTTATYKIGGKTTCAVLAQQAKPAPGSSNPPKTRYWRQGIHVKTAPPGVIAVGTVIATFTAAGRYPTPSEGSLHTALYKSHDSKGIRVIDQWDGKLPSERTLEFNNSDRNVNKGDHFYVVETEETLKQVRKRHETEVR